MLDAAGNLGRTAISIGAIVLRLALVAYQLGITFRAVGDKSHWSGLFGASLELHSGNLRDDLSSLLHEYLIA